MSIAQLVQAALIALGAIVIAAAMFRARRLMDLVASERRAGWRVLRGLMACFLLGYVGAIALILAGDEDALGWLVGAVFLGGAGFVYVVINMSLATMRSLVSTTLSRESYQITLDTVVDAIVTIDEAGTVLFANEGTTRAFGYTRDELLGKNVSVLMGPTDAAAHDGYLRKYVATGEAHIIGRGREVVGRRKEGVEFPLELAINEMWIGDERQFVGSLRDVTERKEVERMKGEFISIVSHELRTPLTSIRGSLGLLLGGVGGELTDKARGLVQIGVRSCDRLVRLINDILDVEKIESGALEMRRRGVAVADLLRTSLEGGRGFAEEHDVALVLDDRAPGCTVQVDEDRVVQVLTNLLSNAIKFSSAGDTVMVRALFRDDKVRFEVSDDGPGIPESFKPQVFEKFVQADASATRKVAGTGLGLSISRAIVEQHGGVIGFETEEGVGTTFFVELDAAKQEERERSEERAPGRGDAPRVLVCEDDAELAEIIATILREEGCVADVALDAAEAKRALTSHDYAALFLDLFLPGQHGISLIRELRADEATRELPIVVVSAVAQEGRAQLASHSFSIIDWIDKPFDAERLRHALAAALRPSSMGRARVLHVEDDEDVAAIVAGYLSSEARITHVATLEDAREALRSTTFDLILLDLELPDGNGLELVPELEAQSEPPQVLVFSGQPLPASKRALVQGALSKGTAGGERLLETARRLLGSRRGES